MPENKMPIIIVDFLLSDMKLMHLCNINCKLKDMVTSYSMKYVGFIADKEQL